jgi:poly(3-hydroxybutyrate) depolymerase
MAVCGTVMLHAAKVDKNVNITVNGESRKYQLYVPTNAVDNCPLVLSLHGAAGHSTDKSPFRTDVADKAGCIVAYPQGKDTYFPVFGGTVPGWDATGEFNSDAKFLIAVIEDVAKKYKIDRNRIYCCGFSNGGMMTYAMTNACSDVFAAFASISGFPLNEFHFRHTGWRPVPFLHIHGKADDFVKYSLMPTIVDEMVVRIGAHPVPTKTTKSGKYTKSIYEAGEGSFPYIYYEMDGMGHNDFTANTEDGNSAQTMWNFFKQYTLDTPCDTTLKWRPHLEATGYVAKSHGWTVNSSKTLLAFGQGSKTDANQNVYRSLQLTTGHYKLCFKSQGETDKTFSAKLQRIKTSKIVFDTTMVAGQEHTIYFDIENDNWGEYRIQFLRTNTTDDITISDIAIYTANNSETITNSCETINNNREAITNNREAINNNRYDLRGMASAPSRGGIGIVRTRNGNVRKTLNNNQ